jgi:hypothetical protein
MDLNLTEDDVKTESSKGQSLVDFEANRITERRVFEDDPSVPITEELTIRSVRS